MGKKKLYLCGAALCALLFCVSVYQAASYYANAKRQEAEFEDLAKTVEEAGKDPAGDQEDGESGLSPLAKYRELFEKNNDMAGWICIEGTAVNFPVMYTPDKPDYYLRRNFDKEYSVCGVPYIAGHCDPIKPSDNLTIYGHHIRGGKMFSPLMEYKDRDFYKSHKTIRFDTLTEMAEYEVIAVFKTTVYGSHGFAYYKFADAADEQEFDSYVGTCKRLALYETGVSASYGDKLISLSTCEYSARNGRLVVVAKKLVP